MLGSIKYIREIILALITNSPIGGRVGSYVISIELIGIVGIT